MPTISDYEPIVGSDVIEELKLLAEKISGKVIQNINSTAVGGGVAEILNRMIPLLKELGVSASWDVIKGGEKFFEVTKKMHNALHNRPVNISKEEYELFVETNWMNAREMDLSADIMFIHDPQPIGLIEWRKNLGGNWIWRCHVDFSSPDPAVWNFLKPYVEQYDVAVFSAPSFGRQLATRQVLISPSIDPLSDKNKELPQKTIDEIVGRYGIDPERPLITQISRFDYLKDPTGVVDVYRMVKKYNDCQLVLAGGGATDDPEGEKVLTEVREKAGSDPEIFILQLPAASDIEINALQRASSVVLQKSLREGFGLTVSEALWKAKPVVATSVGGIPLQITHKYSGLLSYTVEGTAYWVRQLLNSPEYGKKMGENGREHIKQNFLLTRHLRDYMLMFLSLQHNDEDIVYL